MSGRNDGLQAEGSGSQNAPPRLNIQPQEVPEVEEIPRPVEEIVPEDMYEPPPRRVPSENSNESSADALPPPNQQWFTKLLWWLLLHLWALTMAFATGAQQAS